MFAKNKGKIMTTRIPTHPESVLKEELESRNMSQKKFAELIEVSYTQVNDILNEKRPVTVDFALMVEASLGINPELLINMQNRYNMAVAHRQPSLMERINAIHKMCAAVF